VVAEEVMVDGMGAPRTKVDDWAKRAAAATKYLKSMMKVSMSKGGKCSGEVHK
jgi:hypothetical protein